MRIWFCPPFHDMIYRCSRSITYCKCCTNCKCCTTMKKLPVNSYMMRCLRPRLWISLDMRPRKQKQLRRKKSEISYKFGVYHRRRLSSSIQYVYYFHISSTRVKVLYRHLYSQRNKMDHLANSPWTMINAFIAGITFHVLHQRAQQCERSLAARTFERLRPWKRIVIQEIVFVLRLNIMLPLIAHSCNSIQLVDGGATAVFQVDKHGRPCCKKTVVSTWETRLIPG